jgi:uncharacterized protein
MSASQSGTSEHRRQALVTGASNGIGEAFTRRLAADGYDVFVVARNGAKLTSLAQQLGETTQSNIEIHVGDLTDLGVVEAIEQVLRYDRFDLLVNNAGFGSAGAFCELDLDNEDAQVRLNVLALMRLTHAVLPGMLQRGQGSIINVSSMSAFQPTPFSATYGATKAFVNSFTEGLHEELLGSGVRVQVLCPGFTRTGFQKRAGIDVGDLPDFVWMTPEAVVAASLNGLGRGEVVCVPGLANRAVTALTDATPRGIARRLAGVAYRRFFGR